MKTIHVYLSVAAYGITVLTPRLSSSDTAPAYADNTIDTAADSTPPSSIGVSVVASGGVMGFTNEVLRDVTANPVNGLWSLRATIGSRAPIGVDVAYVGTSVSLDSLAGSSSGTLIGTTLEGAIRFNGWPNYDWNPYAFAGVGWQRYDASGTTFDRVIDGISDSDNSITFPLGVGVAYRHPSGLVLDLRGTFRFNTNSGLVLESLESSDTVPLHTWEASAGVGFEF